MPLNIIVCIKQTPATTSIQIDSATGQIRNEGVTFGISPFDEYALEEGIRLKERNPGSVCSALTLGGPNAHEVLREAIARGADGGYHLRDDAFKDSDTLATSYILAQGIKKIEAATANKTHLVLTAKQTNDGDSGQVGPQIAVWLGWPNATFVKKIEEINENKIVVERMMEDGFDVLEMELPAVVAVVKEINEPRLPSLKGKMASKKAVIPTWSAQDIGAEPARIGAQGSPTVIAKRVPPPSRQGGIRIEGGTTQEKAKVFVEKIKEMKLL